MLPPQGFKNTRPALFAGPPTRAGRNGALSLTVRRIRSRGSGTRTRRRLLSHPVLFSLSPSPSLLSRPASLPCPHRSFSFSNLPALSYNLRSHVKDRKVLGVGKKV